MTTKSWLYNEFNSVGKDYSKQEEVAVYDSSHADFRDVEAENRAILDWLDVKEDHTIIDFGTGTGSFAIQAADHCKKVIAIDISEAMLHKAKEKAQQAGLSNIEFHQEGYLSYNHSESPIEAVVSSLSLHHLPDFWKSVALQKIHRMLKPSGKLYLHDVIIEHENAEQNIQAFIDSQDAVGGDFLRKDAEQHFREEFSTFDWVIKGLLQRSGFTILRQEFQSGVFGSYLCQKVLAPSE